MKADTVGLAAVFGSQVRYVVPLFQRPYVWNREDQWEPLWQDVQAVADRQLDDTRSNDEIPHFLGAVVLEQSFSSTGRIDSRSVVDGQQRLDDPAAGPRRGAIGRRGVRTRCGSEHVRRAAREQEFPGRRRLPLQGHAH